MKKSGTDKDMNLMKIMKAVVEKVNEETVDEEESLVWPETPGKSQLSPLEKAIAIAVHAHKGQVDKAGAPYILHPLRVMFQMETEEEMIVAVIHDVIEDTEITLEYLETEGFERPILEAVQSVTRREGETYDDFVIRAGLHPVGARIKTADISDNMDLSRIASVTEKDLKRVQKYHHSLALLDELKDIRKEPAEVSYYKKGGNVLAAKVTLVPRGLSYPNALNTYGSVATVIIDFDGSVSEAVMPEDFMTLRKILKTKDPAMLYDFHPLWAPFFCPECQECYPYGEWDMDDGGYGSCHRGHSRKKEDR